MTMCIGFLCGDGLVVAADRQHTFINAHTFPGCKLHSLKWKNGRAIWGYSGNADTSKIFWRELERRFALDEKVMRDEILDELKNVLEVALRGKKKEVFMTLIGAWTEGEYQSLFMSNGTDVVHADRCEIIGHGDSSLSRFFRGLYLKAISGSTVWQSAVAAVYFLQQEKKYNGQYVGGGTDVFLMTESASELVRIMAPEHCEPLEKEMDVLESRFTQLLAGITNKGSSSEYIAESRRRFDSVLDEFAEKMRGVKFK